jgi:hypothetical protein
MNKQMNAALNNLPNYKGVMICSRPEDNPTIDKERYSEAHRRPFVSRVKEKEKIGITPIKKPVLYTFGKSKTQVDWQQRQPRRSSETTRIG